MLKRKNLFGATTKSGKRQREEAEKLQDEANKRRQESAKYILWNSKTTLEFTI